MTCPQLVTHGPQSSCAGKKSSRHLVLVGGGLGPPCLGDEDSTVDFRILAPTTSGAMSLLSVCSSWHKMHVYLRARRKR